MDGLRSSIEIELSKGWNEPRSAALNYLHDQDHIHYKHARQTTIIAALLFMSLAIIDPLIMPRMIIISPLIRMSVSPLVLFLLLGFIAQKPPLWEVHICMGFTIILAAAVWSYILLIGSDHGPNYYFLTGFLFFPVSNIFMRLKFRIAMLINLLLFVVMGVDFFILPNSSNQLIFVDAIMIFFMAVMTLYTNWILGIKSYTIFLHQTLGSLNQKELASRNQELLALSSTDALTGIGNRRAAEASMAEFWVNCTQNGAPFAIIMIDVDFFKRYNDHYGHVAGDECLKAVAGAAQMAAAKIGSRVFRFGGEEFVIIIECSQGQAALRFADLVREAIVSRHIPHVDRPDARDCVTASIGIAFTGDVAAPGASAVFEAADLALYRAKAAGRNQAVLFVPDRGSDHRPSANDLGFCDEPARRLAGAGC